MSKAGSCNAGVLPGASRSESSLECIVWLENKFSNCTKASWENFWGPFVLVQSSLQEASKAQSLGISAVVLDPEANELETSIQQEWRSPKTWWEPGNHKREENSHIYWNASASYWTSLGLPCCWVNYSPVTRNALHWKKKKISRP